MKVETLEIAWHNEDDKNLAVLSMSFHPSGVLATSGADKMINLWAMNDTINHLFSISSHTKSVNCVKFSPNGILLASGGDDRHIYLYMLDDQYKWDNISNDHFIRKHRMLGHTEDIYDLDWSPFSNYLISGSIDNLCIIWDVFKFRKLQIIDVQSGYIPCVRWDIFDLYICLFCTNGSIKIYCNKSSSPISSSFSQLQLEGNYDKYSLGSNHIQSDVGGGKQSIVFCDDSIVSYFRRIGISPDGLCYIFPCSQILNSTQYYSLCFYRDDFSKPLLLFPTDGNPSVCIQCSPVLFQSHEAPENPSISHLLGLQYHYYIAIGTLDSFYLYDTNKTNPVIFIKDFHFSTYTDIQFKITEDSALIYLSSIDGYISRIDITHEVDGILPKEDYPNIMRQIAAHKEQFQSSFTNSLVEIMDSTTKEDKFIENKSIASPRTPLPKVQNEQSLITLGSDSDNTPIVLKKSCANPVLPSEKKRRIITVLLDSEDEVI